MQPRRSRLPANVASELEAWCGHAQKLTVFEDVALVELRGGDASAVRHELGQLVLDDRPERFLLAKEPSRTVAVLEQRQRIPRLVEHAAGHFADCDGPLGAPAARAKALPKPPARKPVRLLTEDLVGYRADDPEFATALHKAVLAAALPCRLVKQDGLVIIQASHLPQVRSIVKRLGERFDVQLGKQDDTAGSP